MIPTWIVNAIVILLGCVFAIFIGSALPEYGLLGQYLLAVSIFCAVCIALNNVALLLAFAFAFPLAPPVPFFSHFPTFALVMGWAGVAIFFKTCMTKTIDYVPSCNVFIALCFVWVPVRFLMNPVHKLGGSVMGGEGVSGANAYFLYFLAGVLVIMLGAILNSRKKLMNFMMWHFRLGLCFGCVLTVCAFFPVTMGPILARWGMFAAGNLTDGILRLVILPGFGLQLVQIAFCPMLFHLKRYQSFFVFWAGLGMIIIGGNRSAVAALVLAVPITLFLRRKRHALAATIFIFVAGVMAVHFTIDQMDPSQIPPLARGLGVFDDKIASATGGNASANWRYGVWQSGIDKIMQAPLLGKGYGNLDARYNWSKSASADASTDFELVLAAGLAHNGFISAAYGFGIPFMLALTAVFFLRMVRHMFSALRVGEKDPEARDFHAYIAASIATFSVLIYSAADMCSPGFWLYTGLGFILDHVTRNNPKPISTQAKGTIQKANNLSISRNTANPISS